MLVTVWFRCEKCGRHNFQTYDVESQPDPPQATSLICKFGHPCGEIVPRYTFNDGTRIGTLLVIWCDTASPPD